MNISLLSVDRRIKPLVRIGTACLVAGTVMVGLLAVDDRTLGDANVWLKPMKFAFSFWMYNWTLALILMPLTGERGRFLSAATWVNVVTTSIEMFVITVQAGRGVARTSIGPRFLIRPCSSEWE